MTTMDDLRPGTKVRHVRWGSTGTIRVLGGVTEFRPGDHLGEIEVSPEGPVFPSDLEVDPVSEQEQRLDGPEILDATAFGDSVDEIRLDALDKARDLYGPDARLEIVRTGAVGTWGGSRGKFFAEVRVRCLDFPEEDR